MLDDIYEVELGKVYRSKRSGIRFRALQYAKHGQDCSVGMVVYMNLDQTEDSAPFSMWVMEESLFLKRMGERMSDNLPPPAPKGRGLYNAVPRVVFNGVKD